MIFLEGIPYDKNILYQDGFEYKGIKQDLYFQKTYFKETGKTQYFIKSFIKDNGFFTCQGYIYFYLNDDSKASDFIGVFVKKEFRNSGLASLLVASWIDFCFNNGYDFLGTNKTQRKPFLLYLLKTYGFEIFDETIYNASPNTIQICRSNFDSTKYLLFKNTEAKEFFMRGKIAQEDNYIAIDELMPGMSYLDSVLLSQIYHLENYTRASEKTQLVLNRHKK